MNYTSITGVLAIDGTMINFTGRIGRDVPYRDDMTNIVYPAPQTRLFGKFAGYFSGSHAVNSFSAPVTIFLGSESLNGVAFITNYTIELNNTATTDFEATITFYPAIPANSSQQEITVPYNNLSSVISTPQYLTGTNTPIKKVIVPSIVGYNAAEAGELEFIDDEAGELKFIDDDHEEITKAPEPVKPPEPAPISSYQEMTRLLTL